MDVSKEKHMQTRFVLATEPGAALNVDNAAEAAKQLEAYLRPLLALDVQVLLGDNYEEIIAAMERGEIDAARLGPYAFALAQARFGARALVSSVDIVVNEHQPSIPYRSLIFTRADSGITHLLQVKGQKIGFVDPHSASGYLVATFLLQQAGIDASVDVQPVFLYSHQAVAEAVSRGEVAVGAIAEEEFVHYKKEKSLPEIRLLATSPLLSRGPIAVRPGLAPQLERKLLTALEQLHLADYPEGSQLIKMAEQRFVAAVPRERTLKTIAELAGVSYATVSRAISGKDRISPATTRRIRQLVEELGYRPNANARSLHKANRNLIGLFLPSLSYPQLDHIIEGIQVELDKAQMQLLICPTGQADTEGLSSRQQAYFEMLSNSRFEGIILTQWNTLDVATMENLIRNGRPYVLLEQDLLTQGLAVACAWFEAQGQRDIGLISSARTLLEPVITQHICNRLPGIRMEAFTEAEVEKLALALHQQTRPTPTAFLCADDERVLALLRACKRYRLTPPTLTLGTSPLGHLIESARLTFDTQTLGRITARRLLKMLNITLPGEEAELHFQICDPDSASH